MIGYYVHHVGRGHLHRAETLAAELAERGEAVTGLSSLPAPASWPGPWVRLPRDDDGSPHEVTAHGHLHWAPLSHDGLRDRTAAISAWIAAARPDVVVVDVSVEVLLLARLHGVPTVGVVLPGRRDDAPHALGLGVADALVAFWPPHEPTMSQGLPPSVRERLVPVGALSRHPVRPHEVQDRPNGQRTVALLLGRGGHDITADDVVRARAETPHWHWVVLDGSDETWVEDTSDVLARADVVVTHAGQNAIAETAAARRPAVVIPQERPHLEQAATAATLRSGWPALVLGGWPREGWPRLLDEAAGLDARRWQHWCDGRAADRFAGLVLWTSDLVRLGNLS